MTQLYLAAGEEFNHEPDPKELHRCFPDDFPLFNSVYDGFTLGFGGVAWGGPCAIFELDIQFKKPHKRSLFKDPLASLFSTLQEITDELLFDANKTKLDSRVAYNLPAGNYHEARLGRHISENGAEAMITLERGESSYDNDFLVWQYRHKKKFVNARWP